MAQIAAAFAAIGTAIGAALFGAGSTAAAITATVVTTGLTIGTLTAANALLGPHATEAGSPTDFRTGKDRGLTWAVGKCGVAGDIVFEQTSAGDKNKYLHIIAICSAGGPVESMTEGFYANREAVTFSSSRASGGTYDAKMWLRTQVGSQPSTLLTAPSGTGSVPEWTSTHLLSGKAAYRWILQYDQKVYPTGIPKPLVHGKWAKCYDPRLDSTYSGGSGSCRSTDQTTWVWSENPAIVALTWCLGIKENGVHVLGIGATAAQIDVDAFVAAANVCDDNSWKVAGLYSSKDSKWQVLQSILQAGACVPLRLGHQISCEIQTSRTSLATVTSADFLSDVRVTGTVTRSARINQVTPKYMSPDHLWDYVDAAPVTISAYVTSDGQLRPKASDYLSTPAVNQVAQLAAYEIYNAREFSAAGIMKPYWNALRPGDCITINDSDLCLTSQKVVVVSRTRDPSSGCPRFTFRSETDAKHAAALGKTGTAPPTPSVDVVSLTPDVPSSSAWSASGTTVTNSGVSIPAVVVTGAVESAQSALVQQIHVSYRAHGASEWTSYGVYAASATRIEITSVASAGVYDVGIAYVGRGGEGPTLTLDNSSSGYTAGTFAGSGASDDKTPTAVNWTMSGASGGTPTTDTSNTQTFTSINVPITLTLNTSSVSGSGTLEYSKNGGTWTTFTSGGTVSVSVGDTLAFRATNSTASSTYSGTLTIVNTTDSSTTLDTVAWSAVCGGSDVTPDAIAWGPVIDASGGGSATNDPQTFSGIDTTITLTITRSGSTVQMQYNKNGAGLTNISSGGTISIANGDTLSFGAYNFTPGAYSGHIDVTNTTDGSALLNRFDFELLTS